MGAGLWARRSATLYLAAWLMLGLMLAGLFGAASGAGMGPSLLFALPLVLVYACVCGFSAYYLCRAYPLAKKSVVQVAGVFFLTAAIAALLWCAAAAAWTALWQWLAPQLAVLTSPPVMAVMFGVGVLLYGMTACGHYLALEFERARLFETRELELRLLAQDAELRMLRTQIDPHFLFNSLNSISSLTAIDAGAARDMTLRLAGFFRHTLGLEAHRKVSLADEVELVQRFLAIEQVRFGPRLSFACRVEDDAAQCLLPPMILQPLVENAVKHGIGGLLDGGRVTLSGERVGSQLKLWIENDIDPDEGMAAGRRDGNGNGNGKGKGEGEGEGRGIGLANVRQRLLAAYGIEASVHAARTQNTFRVDLVLPAQTGD